MNQKKTYKETIIEMVEFIASRGLGCALFTVPSKLSKELYITIEGKHCGSQFGQLNLRGKTWKEVQAKLLTANPTKESLLNVEQHSKFDCE